MSALPKTTVAKRNRNVVVRRQPSRLPLRPFRPQNTFQTLRRRAPPLRRLVRAPAEAFITNLTNAIKISIQRPLFLATVLLSFFIIFTSIDDFDKGPLGPYFPRTSSNAFVKWVRTNEHKFFAFVAFIPVIMDAPAKLQVFVALSASTWIIIVPQFTHREYYVQAILLHLYLHLKRANDKLVIIAMASFLYFIGFFIYPKHQPTVPKSTPFSG
nr:MAG: hypothetical protein [Drosophila River Almond nege-like virus]